MLSVPQVFMRPKEQQAAAKEAKNQFAHMSGDHLSLLNVYHAWKNAQESSQYCWDNFLNFRAIKQADSIRGQLQTRMTKFNQPLLSAPFGTKQYYVNIRRAILMGFFMQVAHKQRGGHYLTCKDNQIVTLHPSCDLGVKPDFVVYHEFVLTSQNFIRTVSSVEGEWLPELAPVYFDPSNFSQGETKHELTRLFKLHANLR
jgi:pre-mRNA-splicing factor ATP-dependent RNA helicase DHX15/PRP43